MKGLFTEAKAVLNKLTRNGEAFRDQQPQEAVPTHRPERARGTKGFVTIPYDSHSTGVTRQELCL